MSPGKSDRPISSKAGKGRLVAQIQELRRTEEERYEALFRRSPISLWEQDLSALRARLARLTQRGVSDLRAYLSEDPKRLRECALMIRVLDVNETAVRLLGARSREELLGNLKKTIVDSTMNAILEQILVVAKGQEVFETQAAVRTLDGRLLRVYVKMSVLPVSGDNRLRAIVSMMDVTDQEAAREKIEKLNLELESRVRRRTAEWERAVNVLKIREEELRHSESLFRGAFDTAPHGMLLSSAEGTIVRVNSSLSRIMGHEESDLVGRSFEVIAQEEEREILRQHNRALLEGDVPIYQIELRCHHKSGRTVWGLVSASALRDEEGSPVQIIVHFVDITMRRQAQRALAESEARYKSIFDNEHAVMLIVDPDTGRIVDANPAACEFYGYTKGHIRKLQITDLNTQSNRGILSEMRRAQGKDKSHFHFQHRLATGELRDVEVYSGPITVSGRHLLYSIVHDVTQRRAVESALAREARINSSVARVAQAIVSVERFSDRIFEIILEEALALTRSRHGFVSEIDKETGEDVWRAHTDRSGQISTAGDVFAARQKGFAGGRDPFAAALATRRGFFSNTVELPEQPGLEFPKERYLSVPAVVGSELVGQIGLCDSDSDYDARDLKVIERLATLYAVSIHQARRASELEEAKTLAEEASEAKSRFLSTVSHELRTPLNAIIGMADALFDSELSEKQRSYVRIFRGASEHLMALINDVIDLSKVEEGRLELESIPFNLVDIVEQACETVSSRAREKAIGLNVHIRPGTPVALLGDSLRLRQVLVNLMSNAVKFTHEGVVSLDVSETPVTQPVDSVEESPVSAPAPWTGVRFEVHDTGVGIPEDKIESVFGAFTQVDSTTTRRFGGSGLGLTISRDLVRQMGGDIGVHSEMDKGSCFFFELTIRQVREKRRYAIDDDRMLEGARCLIAVPDEPTVIIAAELFDAWGATSSISRDAKELMGALSSEGEFDLVLVDEVLPGSAQKNFWESFFKKVSGESEIAVISSGLSSEEIGPSPGLLEGKTVVLRPVTYSPLETVARMVSERTIKGRADRASTPPTASLLPPARILLAEDSVNNQRVVQAYLDGTEMTLDVADNGVIAVELFKKRAYDLVLMDVQMPSLDGLAATREIRRYERDNELERTPIIALTAHAFRAHTQEILAAGCDMHLPKPIKKATFLEVLGDMLRDKGRDGSPQSSPREPHALTDTPGDDDDMVEIDPVLFPFVSEYLESLEENLMQIRSAATHGQFDDIRGIAHRIKGEGGTYGFEKVTSLGRKIGAGAKRSDGEEVRSSAEELADYLRRVQVKKGRER